MPSPDDDGYLIEFHAVGGAIKVSAIDPVTGIEVSIVGSPTMSQQELAAAAVRKLVYVLEKGGPGGDKSENKDKPSGKRPGKGVVV